MPRQAYRIKTPTLGILSQHGERLPVTIPINAVVRVVQEHDGDRFVDVDWGGQVLTMFMIDLKERGEAVGARGVS